MTEKGDPIRAPDAEARTIAARLLCESRTVALAVLHPDTGAPFVGRIAFALAPDNAGLAFISNLSVHTRALRTDPRASLLLGTPGPRGDPLNQPRLSVQATARFLPPAEAAHLGLRRFWLSRHPKSKLYIDFADFTFVAFEMLGGHLNGGFAKAYALGPNDLKVS